MLELETANITLQDQLDEMRNGVPAGSGAPPALAPTGEAAPRWGLCMLHAVCDMNIDPVKGRERRHLGFAHLGNLAQRATCAEPSAIPAWFCAAADRRVCSPPVPDCCSDVDGLLAERERLQAHVQQLQVALENAIQVGLPFWGIAVTSNAGFRHAMQLLVQTDIFGDIMEVVFTVVIVCTWCDAMWPPLQAKEQVAGQLASELEELRAVVPKLAAELAQAQAGHNELRDGKEQAEGRIVMLQASGGQHPQHHAKGCTDRSRYLPAHGPPLGMSLGQRE